jgi:hypothetical protein
LFVAVGVLVAVEIVTVSIAHSAAACGTAVAIAAVVALHGWAVVLLRFVVVPAG